MDCRSYTAALANRVVKGGGAESEGLFDACKFLTSRDKIYHATCFDEWNFVIGFDCFQNIISKQRSSSVDWQISTKSVVAFISLELSLLVLKITTQFFNQFSLLFGCNTL